MFLDRPTKWRCSLVLFNSLHIHNLCNNLSNINVLSLLIELNFTVYCNFYGKMLAELLPVFYCIITRLFFFYSVWRWRSIMDFSGKYNSTFNRPYLSKMSMGRAKWMIVTNYIDLNEGVTWWILYRKVTILYKNSENLANLGVIVSLRQSKPWDEVVGWNCCTKCHNLGNI